jgi:hypothetical protein
MEQFPVPFITFTNEQDVSAENMFAMGLQTRPWRIDEAMSAGAESAASRP